MINSSQTFSYYLILQWSSIRDNLSKYCNYWIFIASTQLAADPSIRNLVSEYACFTSNNQIQWFEPIYGRREAIKYTHLIICTKIKIKNIPATTALALRMIEMKKDKNNHRHNRNGKYNRSNSLQFYNSPSFVFNLWKLSTMSPYFNIRTTKLPSISTPVRTVAPLM